MQSEHLNTVFARKTKLSGAGVFAVPSPDGKSGSNEFIVFQVVSMHPDRRSYLQRAFSLSQDVLILVVVLLSCLVPFSGKPPSALIQ